MVDFENIKETLPEHADKIDKIEEQMELNKEEFLKQFNDFEQDTSIKILKVLDEKKHMLNVEVYGLAAIIRALIQQYGTPEMIDGVIEYISYDFGQE